MWIKQDEAFNISSSVLEYNSPTTVSVINNFTMKLVIMKKELIREAKEEGREV